MDFGNSYIYEFELWSSSGQRLADISRLTQKRSFTIQRNEAETLNFQLDLYAFEAFADGIGVPANVLLNPYATDVKVKRNGTYLFGTQVVAAPLDAAADMSRVTESGGGGGISSFDHLITVSCQGYLDLFKDRYLTYSYSQQDASFIAGDMLGQAQTAPNGNVGVTLGTSNYLTGVLRDRNYTRQNIKTELQNLTQLIDGRFDFAFDSNKVFNIYSQIGAKRSDIQFTFGGPQGNIIGLNTENSATSLYNEIIGLGSGFGADQIVSTQDDPSSQLNRYLRQDIKQYNSVVIQSTLDQNAQADLALEKDLLVMPQITISGKELQNIPFISVGDRIQVNAVGHSFLTNLNGYYRVEKMAVSLDDNDFESEIRLYLDNYALTS
jgi:hypothetical protein